MEPRQPREAVPFAYALQDELVLEAPTPEVARVSRLAVEAMEGVIELDVPLVVDVGSGPTWADC